MDGLQISSNPLAPIIAILDNLLKMKEGLRKMKGEQVRYTERIADQISRDADQYTADISHNIDELVARFKKSLDLQSEALEKLIRLEQGGIR